MKIKFKSFTKEFLKKEKEICSCIYAGSTWIPTEAFDPHDGRLYPRFRDEMYRRIMEDMEIEDEE